MPTGKEVIKDVIKYIYTYSGVNIPDFDESLDNDFTPIDQAINDLTLQGGVPSECISLLECLQENDLGSQFLSDQFTNVHKIEIIDFNSTEFRKRNRAFAYSDSQFGYLSTKYLIKGTTISQIINDNQGYRSLIDFLGAAIVLSERTKIGDVLRVIQHSDVFKGLLVHKFANAESPISVYSYLFFQKLLQGGKIELDSTLNYSGTHGASVTFQSIIYQQYFELFDIINEVNHSSEIVTRFLKVYHMLEYLVYRVELVSIELKARINRSFIRELHGLAGKGSSEKEFDIFKKNFSVIFKTEIEAGYFSFGTLTSQQTIFLKDKIGLNPYSPTEKSHVCKLIYILRNSIVHNKESEFHITTTNPDEYADFIPLINQLIQKLETTIFDKIALNTSQISYQSNVIELY